MSKRKPANKRIPGLRPLQVLCFLSVLLPTIFVGVTSWRSLQRHFADAEDRLSRTLSVVHEHAVKVFETQELVALQVDTLLDGLTDEEVQSRELTLNTRLKTLIAALPQIQDIWVIDQNGHPLLTGNIFPAPRTLDLSDREYFRIQQDGLIRPGETYVSEVLQGRAQNIFFFLLSRRRLHGGEPIMSPAFTGVTVVSIAQAYFNRYFADLIHGGGFATAILVREDGAVLARYPALPIDERGPPRLSPSSGFMQALRTHRERGFYTTMSFFDGVERTLTYARLPRHPVYVGLGFDTGSVWKTWRAELIGQLAFAVPATLALVLIALLALRRAQREIAAVQERRRAEAQMQDLRSELLHVSRLTAMGQMASVLAHELNQPLAAASNYLGAAKRLPVVDGSRAMAFVDKAGQQILRAGEIIRRLRDFVADGQLTRRPEDLGPVLKESAALALMDRSHRSITVVERVDPGARFGLMDRVQIQQVLVNLIRNAAEAMEGSPRREITLATAPHEVGLIEVSVADTGPGLPADVAGRLFEPFVTTKPDGMGVGLSICRTIIEAHGGHIRAEANPEGGTVFRFTLEASEGLPLSPPTSLTYAPGRPVASVVLEQTHSGK